MSGTRKSSPPTSSPPRPRALRAADRFVTGSKSPGPGPLLPAAPIHELCPSTRAILAGSRPSQTHPSAVVPIRSRPAHRPRTIPQQLRATPRQATTPGLPLLRALTRVPSCATRAHCALQLIPAAPTGSAFPLKTGSVFLLGTSVAVLAMKLVWPTKPKPPSVLCWPAFRQSTHRSQHDADACDVHPLRQEQQNLGRVFVRLENQEATARQTSQAHRLSAFLLPQVQQATQPAHGVLLTVPRRP